MRAFSFLFAVFVSIGSRPATPVSAQGLPDGGAPAEAPFPWALREAFDPTVIPGFAAWFQRSVDRVVEDAIDRRVTPGAYVMVGRGGEVVLSRGYGHLDWAEDAPPVTAETLWDLASITKALATTLAVMVLVEEGRIDLDAPVHRYLDGWPQEGPRGSMTLRHLLSHTSGLPTGLPAKSVGTTRAKWLSAISAAPLAGDPGERESYSDLGPIVAAWIVEAVADEPFQSFVDRRIYRPLGLTRTLFRPLETGVGADEVAPTEVLAEGHLRGVVHDPVARALGGVAGNAGLFSSAADLAVLASALLWEKPFRIVCRDRVRSFTRRPDEKRGFAVGWELPAPWTPGSELPSATAFGHMGYTGTSLWIDPELDLFVILLTSRLNPTSANEGHVALRWDLHGIVGRAYTGLDPDEWRVPETWRGVDSCRAEVGFPALAKVEPATLGALAGW